MEYKYLTDGEGRQPMENGVGGHGGDGIGLENGSANRASTPTGTRGGSTCSAGTSGGRESVTSFFSKQSSKAKSTRSGKRRSKRRGASTNNTELSQPLTASSTLSLGDRSDVSASGDVELGQHPPAPGVEDPFQIFKDDLSRKLSLADEGLDSYLEKVRNTDTSVNQHDVKSAKKQLKRHLKHADSALKDLQKTIRSVETRRSQFLHISDEELENRRIFVSGANDRIRQIRTEMSSEEVKDKILRDERALTARRMGAAADGDEGRDEDTSLIVDGHAQAQVMLQEQDETLEELDDAVERVGQMAGEINAELGTQSRMLQELDDDLHDAEEKLGLVMGKLAKLLKTKSKCQLGTILVLMLTVIVLFFLVIYT